MNRGRYFWALMIILLGVLLLLSNFDLIQVNIWGLIWPIFLVALGVWFLLGTTLSRRTIEAEEVSIPLEGAAEASLRIKHGAGRMHMGIGPGMGQLLEGRFGYGLKYTTQREGDHLRVEMKPSDDFLPNIFMPWMWGPGGALDWDFGLTPDIPLNLHFETGAGEAGLDMRELKVKELRLQTGASATTVTLPARAGYTRVNIEAGVASVRLTVPEGVAVDIKAKSGLASVQIDQKRFPRQGEHYRSPDYENAANKIDMVIETGVGSVEVR